MVITVECWYQIPWYFNLRRSRYYRKLPWYFYNTGQKYHGILTLGKGGCFYNIGPWANVIKLFTVVIYCHSVVISSFCAIKLYYLGNYHGMAVNYHGIKWFYNIGQKSVL
jgi:hypothetical protein